MKNTEDILAIIKSLLLAKNEGAIGLRQADRLIAVYDKMYQDSLEIK
jgi:hypothetical protein